MSTAPAERIVVIGTSAGGAETLRRVVAGLPADLRAAIVVVMHLHPTADDFLAGLLERTGALPARLARDGDSLVAGEILVAVPDRHLEVHGRTVAVTAGPRENGFRPAIDTTMRTAADAFGAGAVGVVLSGMLDDGAFGLRRIRAAGGIGLVEDPASALYGDMPQAAIDAGGASEVHGTDDLAEAITRAVGAASAREEGTVTEHDGGPDHVIHADRIAGELVTMACPSCGGNLWEQDASDDGPSAALQYRCRTGHRFSPTTLLTTQDGRIEDAMWGAYRALLERAEMGERLADRFGHQGIERSQQRWSDLAGEARRRAEVLRQLLDEAATA